MKKSWWWLGIVGLLIGLGIVLWWWPYLCLPGEIAMGHSDYSSGDTAIYLFKPSRFLGSRWTRITPPEIYAKPFPYGPAWAPDGRQVAFWCSDGILLGTTPERVRRPGKMSEIYDAQQMIVKEGICLVGRDGEHFRWLVDTAAMADLVYNRGDLSWTLDGQYIVFPTADWQQNYRVDAETGEWTMVEVGLDVWKWKDWQEEFFITESAAQSAEKLCPLSGGTYLGSSSAGGRYMVFSTAYGESDPQCLYAYDARANRLLFLERARGFAIFHEVWLPN
jgi:hypothetical protein